MAITDELARKLKAVQALAERGFGGEQRNAQRILHELMKKYDVTEEELEGVEVQTYWFDYSQEIERRLLNQIIFMVTGNGGYGCRGARSGRTHKKMGADCTKAEWFEIKTNYGFFKAALEKELDIFMAAFANKNDLFPSVDKRGEVKTKDVTDEEIAKITMMAMGMDQHTLKKGVAGKDGLTVKMPDYFLCGICDCFYCRIDGICNRGEFAFDEAIKTNDDIAVLIDTFVEPPCFDSFKNHDDYSSAYWMICKDNEGVYRYQSHGKRLKVNGFTLYTESRIYQGLDNDDLALLDVRVTEEKTGLAATLYDFHNEERIERIKQIVQAAQKVLSVERIKEAKDQ